jgi:hypothetical protein
MQVDHNSRNVKFLNLYTIHTPERLASDVIPALMTFERMPPKVGSKDVEFILPWMFFPPETCTLLSGEDFHVEPYSPEVPYPGKFTNMDVGHIHQYEL